jgi:hypothetical protein
MADQKISQLTASTTPLAGTEVLPIVQSGVTKKTSVESVLSSVQPSGTANGVTYLNASKVLTSGSVLTFDGTNVGVGTTTPVSKLSVVGDILAPSVNTDTTYAIGIQDAQANGFVGSKRASLKIQASSAAVGGNGMGAGDLTLKAGDAYTSSPGLDGDVNIIAGRSLLGPSFSSGAVVFNTNNTERMRIDATGNATVSTGNLVIGTSGKGIDFSADGQAAGMTSELLDDYEEGTWTPDTSYATFVGAPSSEGTYTKIGRTVVVRGSVTGGTSVAVGATGILVGGLPFTPALDSIGIMAASTNTESGGVRATGPFLVATNNMTPTPSITFTATYFV